MNRWTNAQWVARYVDGWMDGRMDGQKRVDRLIEDGKTDTSDGQRTKETNMET